ncbi:SH3 domain-containing protein [Streptomyces sp. NBC_00829]|uniref:SH3 domain-containing protein n=1 Tax=Streptomyces sp. NBC_00829 TaxID=2903679 RepID=UPI002F91BC97|nr:SH3 domain-containing protein [Streptomyces sp. NBC_00829]
MTLKHRCVQRAAVAAAVLSMSATALAVAPTAQAAQTSINSSASSCSGIWWVTGNGVNFRRGAGTAYGAIGSLYRYDQGRRIGSHGAWIRLRLTSKSKGGLPAGSTGWVSRHYLNECVPTQLD